MNCRLLVKESRVMFSILRHTVVFRKIVPRNQDYCSSRLVWSRATHSGMSVTHAHYYCLDVVYKKKSFFFNLCNVN